MLTAVRQRAAIAGQRPGRLFVDGVVGCGLVRAGCGWLAIAGRRAIVVSGRDRYNASASALKTPMGSASSQSVKDSCPPGPQDPILRFKIRGNPL
jgi:hypothetical protein